MIDCSQLKITPGTHVKVHVPPNTLVKEFKPKYKLIEVIEELDYPPFGRPIALMNLKDFKAKYGKRLIVSVIDFNDCKHTSIAIERIDYKPNVI